MRKSWNSIRLTVRVVTCVVLALAVSTSVSRPMALVSAAVPVPAAPVPAVPVPAVPVTAEDAVAPSDGVGSEDMLPGSYPFLPRGLPIPTVPQRSPVTGFAGPDLAAHLPYRVEVSVPDRFWKGAESAYRDVGQLTDGRYGSLDFTDPAWVGYQYQYDHAITIDLEQPCSLHAFSLDALQNLGAGIVFPRTVEFSVSLDGKRWASVGTVAGPSTLEDYRPQSFAYRLSRHRPVNARYVRASFTNQVWTFLDEFSVSGSPGWSPAARTPHPLQPTAVQRPSGYARVTAGSLRIHNLLLVYTHDHGRLGQWTAKDFAPVIQPDAKPSMARPLFDGVLFTPYRLPTAARKWDDWLDDLFGPGYQLAALDAAVAAHQPRWWRWVPWWRGEERIVITIPTLRDVQAFRIPGEAKPISLSWRSVGLQQAQRNKSRVMEWYVNEVVRRWRLSNHPHLRLVGLAWQPESLNVLNPHDAETVRAAADIVHRHQLGFVWLPFYGAIGADRWRTLGFDLAILQPNVSFHWHMNPAVRLASVSRFARTYGMGMEMEAHWHVVSAYPLLAETAQRLYYAYLRAGKTLGYQDDQVVKGWYMNSKTLLDAFGSKDPKVRRVYDHTVDFIRGRSWQST